MSRQGVTGPSAPAPLVLDGELSIVVRSGGCAALVLDYFSPWQRDLIGAIREQFGPAEHGFGEERFGRVSIVVRPLAPLAIECPEPASRPGAAGAAELVACRSLPAI